MDGGRPCLIVYLSICPIIGRTLPGVGMHWEIYPHRPSRLASGGEFASLGPRDRPQAVSQAWGCIIAANRKSFGPRGMYLASQDALEVMYVSQSVSE